MGELFIRHDPLGILTQMGNDLVVAVEERHPAEEVRHHEHVAAARRRQPGRSRRHLPCA